MLHEDLGRSPVCLIIPGLNNSGPDHWQTLWEAERGDCERVPLGVWSQPRRNTWTARIDQAVRQAPAPVVLVAHSLGCIAVAWWAATVGEAAGSDVVGALLVAPPDVDTLGDPLLHGFSPIPRKRLPFRTIMVASRNDPYCRFEGAEDLATGWGAELIDAGEAGHLNSESGLGRWAEGQALLGALLGSGNAPVRSKALPRTLRV